MKTERRRICILLLVSLFLCAGCGGRTAEENAVPEGAVTLYYIDHDKTGMETEAFTPVSDPADTSKLAEEVLLALHVKMAGTVYDPVTGEDSLLLSCKTEGTLVTLDYAARYTEMDPATELLYRACVVRTLTGTGEIDSVLFLVSGTSLMKEDGTAVGVMREDSFLFHDGNSFRYL